MAHLVLRSPAAVVSIDAKSLLTGTLQPRAIEFRDLQVRAALNRDGSLSFVAAEGSEPQAVTSPPPGGAPDQGSGSPPDSSSVVALALGSLFDLVLEPRGVVGALDRARVTNARLVLVDTSGRERAAFSQVTGSFERAASGGRRFDFSLEGPRGRWQLNGDLKGGTRHRGGSIAIADVPLADLMLLSGLSNAPATTDLKLSGHATAFISEGRLASFETQLTTDAGMVQIDDKDMPPIDVAAASAHGLWDEARRTFALDAIAFKSAGDGHPPSGRDRDGAERRLAALGDGPRRGRQGPRARRAAIRDRHHRGAGAGRGRRARARAAQARRADARRRA